MTVLNRDLFGNPADVQHGSALAETFSYPPFSVWSARDGWWQERKRAWLALGIKSELGRGGQNNVFRQDVVLGEGGLADQLGHKIKAKNATPRGGLDAGNGLFQAATGRWAGAGD
jgi:hypothetical protein